MEITTIGLDLAKEVFQVHGVDGSGEVKLRKRHAGPKSSVFSLGCLPAWWPWRRVLRLIIGLASWRLWDTP